MDRGTLEELSFNHDFDRALASRFAPRHKRPGLMALIALDYELSKIDRATSDPMLRRIKIEFWREAIFENKNAGLPLVTELRHCFSTNSKQFEDLELLLSAHEKRLNTASPDILIPRRNKEGQAALFKLACNFLEPSNDATNDAFFEQCGGVYDGLGQLREMMCNVDHENADEANLVERIRRSYQALQETLREMPVVVRAGILPLALVSPYLDLYQTSDKKIEKRVDVHPLRRAFLMWRAVRSGFKAVK
ncbi:MAG: squalene/phytoene synthase family protein [Hyphomicrobiaceae bacterium]|nr:squalene/phytoene synthase family protein [Hyphomicrobiaceae bacterium]